MQRLPEKNILGFPQDLRTRNCTRSSQKDLLLLERVLQDPDTTTAQEPSTRAFIQEHLQAQHARISPGSPQDLLLRIGRPRRRPTQSVRTVQCGHTVWEEKVPFTPVTPTRESKNNTIITITIITIIIIIIGWCLGCARENRLGCAREKQLSCAHGCCCC